MGWSTTVVVPPDGDMGDYMASLDKLRERDDRIYYPAHGPAVTKPQQLVRGLIGHRMQRERQILKLLAEGAARRSPTSSPQPIPGSTRGWCRRPAGRCCAHLLDLERRGLVEQGRERHGRSEPAPR